MIAPGTRIILLAVVVLLLAACDQGTAQTTPPPHGTTGEEHGTTGEDPTQPVIEGRKPAGTLAPAAPTPTPTEASAPTATLPSTRTVPSTRTQSPTATKVPTATPSQAAATPEPTRVPAPSPTPTSSPTPSVEESGVELRLIRRSGETIGHPHYDGWSLIGLERYVHFESTGRAGEVDITVEIHEGKLPVLTGPLPQTGGSPAISLTRSFDIREPGEYILTIHLDVGRTEAPEGSVYNNALRVCYADPVTGLPSTTNCTCGGYGLSLRVFSEPEGLGLQTPGLVNTCAHWLHLREITLNQAPPPTPTPTPGPVSLEAAGTWVIPGADEDRVQSRGVAVGPDGNVYVAATDNHQIVVFDMDGAPVRRWGSEGRGEGQLSYPNAIAVDENLHVYVADTLNNRVQVFGADGEMVRVWGLWGSGNGELYMPRGIALGPNNEVFVSDTGNNRVQVFDADGGFRLAWGSSGQDGGEFDEPGAIAVDGSGRVYVADTGNQRVQVFDRDGRFIRAWDVKESGDEQAGDPSGIAVGDGYVYVTDGRGHRVLAFNPEGAAVDAWVGSVLDSPRGVAISTDGGELYVTDSTRDLVHVLTIDKD